MPACSVTLRASGLASSRASLVTTASGVLSACARLPTWVRARSTMSWLDLSSALSSCCSGSISSGRWTSSRVASPERTGGQALLHLGQRQEAEADLEQRDGEQADAGQRQRQGEARAEVVQAGLHLAQRAGDGDGVALRLLALAEDVDGLGDAQLLIERAVEAGPAHLALVGLDALLARQRDGEAGERAGGELVARLVERLDLPVPARMRDLEQRLADVLGRTGLDIAVVDRVGENDGEQHAKAPVEAGLDLLAVERIDDGARDRQHQQVPGGRGGEEPERQRVSCHRPPATAGSPGRGWS